MKHSDNNYPAPCCGRHGSAASMEAAEPRVTATCCVVTAAPDDYGTMTLIPKCWCKRCCPICNPRGGAA